METTTAEGMVTPKVGTESHQLLLRSLYAVLREPHMQLPRYSLLLLLLPLLLLPLLLLPPPLLVGVLSLRSRCRCGAPRWLLISIPAPLAPAALSMLARRLAEPSG